MTATLDSATAPGGGRPVKKKLYADVHVGFAYLRILGALFVVFEHAIWLPDPTQNVRLFGLGLGEYALLVFFASSGYQIADSWERDPSWWRFSARRVLRIVPPLAVVLAFTVFVLGPIFTTLPLGDYFSDGMTWSYLAMVVPFFLQGPLPGVFETNAHNFSVNPSLWTLPMEIFGYGIVLLVGLAIAIGVNRLILPVLLAGLMVTQGVLEANLDPYDAGGFIGVMPVAPLVSFMVVFVAGALLHTFRDKIPFRPRYALTLVAIWLVVQVGFMPDAAAAGETAGTDGSFFQLATLDHWLLALTVAYGSVTLGSHWPKRLERYAPWVYGSYGWYIWGAPLQQTLIALGVTNGWVLFAISAPVGYLLGLLSWRLVEAPTQKWRRYLNARDLPLTAR